MLDEMVEAVRCRWCDARRTPSSWCPARTEVRPGAGRLGVGVRAARGRVAGAEVERPGSVGQPTPSSLVGPAARRRPARVVALAADTLGALAEDEVPAALQAVPVLGAAARRTKLAATPLAAAVERDVLFRQRVAGAGCARRCPTWPPRWTPAAPPPAADPVDVAAVAYLLRTPGWARPGRRGRRAADAGQRRGRARRRRAEALARLQEALAAAERARHARSWPRLRAELTAAPRRGRRP